MKPQRTFFPAVVFLTLALASVRAEVPVITADDPPPSGTVGEAYLYDFDITPIPQVFSVSNKPNGLTESPVDYSLSGTPTESGTFDIVIYAKSFDGQETQVTRRIVIASAPAPDDPTPPTIAITGHTVTPLGGNNFVFSFLFLAQDNHAVANLEYRGAVSHGDFDAWKTYPYLPGEAFVVGLSCTAFDLEVRAVDTTGNRSAAARFTFDAPVAAPTLKVSGVVRGKLKKPLRYRVTAATATQFSASNLPPGCRIDAASGVISGVPKKKGTFRAKIVASNSGGSDSATLRIVIAK